MTTEESFETLIDRVNDLELTIQHQICWHVEKLIDLNDCEELTDQEWNSHTQILSRLEVLLNTVEMLRERQVK